MNVQPRRTTIRAERAAGIGDGPHLKKGNRTYRAQTIRVTYLWDGVTWKTQHTEVAGPVIKKDGSDSLNTATTNYWSGIHPKWVADIVNQLRPHGAPVTRTSQFEVEV